MGVLFRPDPLLDRIKQGLQHENLFYSITGSNTIQILQARPGRLGIVLTYTRSNAGQIRDSSGLLLGIMPITPNFLWLSVTLFPTITGSILFADSVGTASHGLRIIDQFVE